MEYSNNWQSLINVHYKNLLNKNRCYAAFTNDQIEKYIFEFKNLGAKRILDPMSGYGTLTELSAKYNISTFGIESNFPSYLWQFISIRPNMDIIIEIIPKLIKTKKEWYIPPFFSEISDNYITENGLRILKSIHFNCLKILDEYDLRKDEKIMTALSIFLPFSCRVSSITKGDVVHVKKGGLAIYRNYKDDFIDYLYKLKEYLTKKINLYKNLDNYVMYDDCKISKFNDEEFQFMITSPPYPNLMDYSKMFIVENYIVKKLIEEKIINISFFDDPIGTNKVSGKKYGELISKNANLFIEKILQYDKTEKAIYQNKKYYVPYFKNYFFGIQEAYINLSTNLKKDFNGIIIVRNNTARSYTVPVSDSIIDIWNYLGYEAYIDKSTEKFHTGTKGRHGKGFNGKHLEYSIRIRS